MKYPGIADEAQLAILTKMLDDHCTERGIPNGDPAREALGRRIMALFNCRCYSFEQIEEMLRRASAAYNLSLIPRNFRSASSCATAIRLSTSDMASR